MAGFLLLGYDQGVMSGIVRRSFSFGAVRIKYRTETYMQIGADNQFGRDFGHPDPTTQGTIVAIYVRPRSH